MVELESGAILAANGGGGGSDGGTGNGEDGHPSDMTALGPLIGGDGNTPSTADGSPGGAAAGNGGGGGAAAGRIRINTGSGSALDGGAMVSPNAGTGCFTEGTAGRQ